MWSDQPVDGRSAAAYAWTVDHCDAIFLLESPGGNRLDVDVAVMFTIRRFSVRVPPWIAPMIVVVLVRLQHFASAMPLANRVGSGSL